MRNQGFAAWQNLKALQSDQEREESSQIIKLVSTGAFHETEHLEKPGLTLPVSIVENNIVPEISQVFDLYNGNLSVSKNLSGAEIGIIGPGKTPKLIINLVRQYREIKAIHIIEIDKKVLDSLETALRDVQRSGLKIPKIFAYAHNLLEMPKSLTQKLDLVIQQSVIDPDAFSIGQLRVAADQIKMILKPNGVFLSAGKGSNWVTLIPIENFHTQLMKPKSGSFNYGIWFSVKTDKAMTKDTGGIDLTPANMNLQTKIDSSPAAQNDGGILSQNDKGGVGNGKETGGIKFHLTPAMLQQIQNAPGFVPVIINIQPMTDLRLFLGLDDNPMNSTPMK